jgi:hypothetical protein
MPTRDVAIRAINDVALDHYLLKPWDPPDEHLYPVLDDLLAAWQSAQVQPFTGVTVVGHRWSPDSHRLRDFLVRNLVPYRWLDASDRDAAAMLEAAEPGVPPIVVAARRVLQRPSTVRRRVCGRCSSSTRLPAARPARARGSRTTSASRPVSAAATSRGARRPRRGGSGPRC